MTTSEKQNKAAAPAAGGTTPAQIRWIEAAMQTAFANVVNVQSTREQVDLFFGTNRTWNPETGSEVRVELSHRIILTPFAAKRLATVLGNVLTEYESRFGAIDISA